ncbi:alpha/beta fold hydrolase [Butyrivibrio proteoclasticus]|uniref:alpha/beta fold hydrolase n=1 Tax=Butyrivibrio proteoclasticus TaxID=43305 RepID=UPI00047D5073|nr:alpha/beta hydrolase [Butyrivibrio proteoclasticus]
MIDKYYETKCGKIHYWINTEAENKSIQLILLPGLTADHTLYEKQIEYFEGRYPLFVWDAPGHASSYPFELSFSLKDKAIWLDEILKENGFDNPVIVGQSMGGYVGQMYSELFPDKLRGFVSVDSAPLQKKYMTGAEIWLMKVCEPVFRYYPWKLLVKQGAENIAMSEYGRKIMHDIIMTYDGDKERYVKLVGHGYRILAAAVEENLPYEIKCPAILLCGTKDKAGSCIRYDKAWHKETQIPIHWIEGAGHNSNTDDPEKVNHLIKEFVENEVILPSTGTV